jgi:LysM repeat protein
MSRRALFSFIILNVIVSVSVAFIVISYDRSRRPEVEPIEGPAQIVYITVTPIPGSSNIQPYEYQSTIDAQQLTLAALSRITPVVTVVTSEGAAGIEVGETPMATIPPELLPPIPTDLPPGQASATLQNNGCIQHVIQSGDMIITLAQRYGVFPGDILLANGMTEDDAQNLQIGDVLIIPVEGCMALTTPTLVLSPSNTPFQLTRVAPTVTLPPTVANAQVAITDVLSWGDINNEAVELRNLGSAVNLDGWTLSDAEGNSFRFPEFRMQQGSLVRIYTRQGQNTPAALFWNRDTPAWNEGETITLTDATGQVQATFQVGALFQAITPTPAGLPAG